MLLTLALLSVIVGVVVSLVFSWFPKLNEWYAGLTSGTKKLIMLAIAVLSAGVIFAFNCFGLFQNVVPVVSCDQAGAESYIVLLVAFALGNQATYSWTPTTKKVAAAKAARVK